MSRHIDKEALVTAVMSSTELDNEQKSQLIRLIREQKKYGLVWEDSTEDAWEKMKTTIPVLNEVDDKRILNDKDGEHYPNHAIIEADNLHALIALTYTHAGMIDVIYIDPPYNTGNKDFVYNDSFIGEDDAYRHSKWLAFMEKRLQIAKMLLSEKGVIFISIDDNEQANLKLLCDEVFGETAYVSTLLIESSVIAGPRRVPAMQGSVVKTAEYCLIYTRSEDTKIMRKLKYDFISGFDTHYNKWLDKENGKIISLTDLLQNTEEIAEIFRAYKMPISIQSVGVIITIDKRVREWLYSKEIASCLYRQGDMENINDTNIPINHIFKLNNKWYVKTESATYNVFRYIDRIGECDDYFHSYGERTVRGNLWKGFSSDGGNLDKEGGVSFKSGKKPIRLVKQLIDSVCNTKDSIVLDFFAGSGTTMHATMLLNEEDGGHRRAILVTNNENRICENVTYVRNKNIVCGYGKVAGLNHNNLRYYKLDFNPRKQSHQDNRELFYGLKDLLCIKENIYQEEQQFGSLSLNGKEQMLRYFAENGREMLMVYDTRVIPFIVNEIAQRKEQEQPLKIYIFADGAYPYTDDFASVVDKVSLVPMPYAYYRGIKDSLPEAEPTKVDNTELTNEEQQTMMAEAIAFESKE